MYIEKVAQSEERILAVAVCMRWYYVYSEAPAAVRKTLCCSCKHTVYVQ